MKCEMVWVSWKYYNIWNIFNIARCVCCCYIIKCRLICAVSTNMDIFQYLVCAYNCTYVDFFFLNVCNMQQFHVFCTVKHLRLFLCLSLQICLKTIFMVHLSFVCAFVNAERICAINMFIEKEKPQFAVASAPPTVHWSSQRNCFKDCFDFECESFSLNRKS